MGRPARYPPAAFLSAALDLASADPAQATVAAIARRVGAPIGSVYHRFDSRDALVAEVWLRAVEAFQAGFLAALAAGDATGAACHTPRWSRAHVREARLLLAHRTEDLVSERWPEAVAERAARLRSALERGLRGFARRRYGRADAALLRRVRFALVDVPYAGVRPHLARGEAPPEDVEALVTAAASAVLAGGEASCGS